MNNQAHKLFNLKSAVLNATQFSPKVTSSPSVRVYGSNDLDLTVSKACLVEVQTPVVEKCRKGYSSTGCFDTIESITKCNDDISDLTFGSKKKSKFSYNLQKLYFEAGLKNRLLSANNKKSKQSVKETSYISSIYNSSINSAVEDSQFHQQQFKSVDSCSCFRNNSVQSSSTRSSDNIEQPIDTHLTFKVEMASTPKTIKRRSVINRDEEAMVSVRSECKYCANNLKCQDAQLKAERKRKSKQNVETNSDILNLIKPTDNTTNNELLTCNSYLKRILKMTKSKKSIDSESDLKLRKEIKRKLIENKLNNLTTSTRKTPICEKPSSKRKMRSSNSKDSDLAGMQSRKRRNTFKKDINSVPVISNTPFELENLNNLKNNNQISFYNNYLPNNNCLNNFNQLGQLQVWYV